MAKKVTGMIKLQVQAGKGQSCAAYRPGARSARCQYPGLLQGVQRAHQERCRPDHPGRHHRLTPTVPSPSSPRPLPVPVLIKKALGLESGSGKPNKTKVGQLTQAQVREIAEKKMPDLNAANIESAMSMVKGYRPLHGRDCRRRLTGGEKRGLPREAACVKQAGNCGRIFKPFVPQGGT